MTGKWLARALGGLLIILGALLVWGTPVFLKNPGGATVELSGWCMLVGGCALIVLGLLKVLIG